MSADANPSFPERPARHKPAPQPVESDTARHELAAPAERPTFLREVAQWDVLRRRMLFQILVPIHLLADYQIDPIRLADPQGRPVAFLRLGMETGSCRLELLPTGDATEPMAELELADTPYNQIEVLWVTLQDPQAPRFDTDVLPGGESTLHGTARRNLAAEQAAMAAGLAPGQTRRGLGSFRWLNERLETVMLCLGQREFVARPLFYHTAILFEQSGFSYIQGQARMEAIARGFTPDGELHRRLNGSTPFRRPEQAGSIRGRSWAIHDGILDEPWDRMQMVKRLGIDAGINTGGLTSW